MSIRRSITGIFDRPPGRVLVLVVGACLIYLLVTAFPATRPVIRWSFPTTLILWGLSRLHIYRAGDTLTLVAGCLLVAGGITRGLFQVVPMTELAGTVANLVPLVGIFAEMYAHHYRTASA